MHPAELNRLLHSVTGSTPDSVQAVGGGDISPAWRVQSGPRTWFMKTGPAEQAALFAAEAAGLDALRASGAVRVPMVLGHGSTADSACLLLEWLDLHTDAADARLGEALATLHGHTVEMFGWERDNFIGRAPQHNRQTADWVTFWREQRLAPQLRWTAKHGGGARLREQGLRLLEKLPVFFTTYQPVPSLLHGDLWGGNQARLPDGVPVLFDPAVYYGDRETDLAMSELFGGFSADFYAAYRTALPLDAGYTTRRLLYQLYHVLNHFNLFGGGYGAQAESLIARLLAETGHA